MSGGLELAAALDMVEFLLRSLLRRNIDKLPNGAGRVAGWHACGQQQHINMIMHAAKQTSNQAQAWRAKPVPLKADSGSISRRKK